MLSGIQIRSTIFSNGFPWFNAVINGKFTYGTHIFGVGKRAITYAPFK
jgi:hypothetical protein